MPYRVQKPYIIANGQKLVSPNAVPQGLPVCDRCNELASTNASVYRELALDKMVEVVFLSTVLHANRKRSAWDVRGIPSNQKFASSTEQVGTIHPVSNDEMATADEHGM